MGKVYVLINDRKKEGEFPRTYYSENKAEFERLNADGWGVYCAVNDFEATDQQMRIAGVKTKRNIQFLEKINSVFADLDIAKAGDGMERGEKEKKKEALLFALYDVFPPSEVIDTSNGIQPLWHLKGSSVDADYQERYVNVINGIIAWSTGFGAMGDKVKDVTRVLRLPGYNHMKEKPYMVEAKYKDDFIYTLEQLEDKFKKYIIPEKREVYKPVRGNLDDLSLAIDSLDIHEVAKLAFAEIGRSCEFDKQDRIILDGRLTGGFKSKKGNFIATTSHEAFDGNLITLVAEIKTITNKEAREWLIEKFNLRKKIAVKKLEKLPIVKPTIGYYSWGTKELTDSFAPIKRGTYAIVGSGYGVGKTTFCMNLGLENAKLGHKVLYLSLEMDNDEIFSYLSRKAAGITIPEENNNQIPQFKTDIYNARKVELATMPNFSLKGIRGGSEVNWDLLVGLMDGDWDLIIVDNFNLISKSPGSQQFDHEGDLSKKFLNFAASKQVPVIVVHHFSKGGARENMKSGYSLSGSSRIVNDASRIVLLSRERQADEADAIPLTEKEKAMMKVVLDKGRGYDGGVVRKIYFQKGVFKDDFVESQPAVHWQDKI